MMKKLFLFFFFLLNISLLSGQWTTHNLRYPGRKNFKVAYNMGRDDVYLKMFTQSDRKILLVLNTKLIVNKVDITFDILVGGQWKSFEKNNVPTSGGYVLLTDDIFETFEGDFGLVNKLSISVADAYSITVYEFNMIGITNAINF
jgi:hypothetical protein